MARVNVEEKAFTEDAHRFKRLGQRLRISSYDVYGRVLFVWRLAQQKRRIWLSVDELDGAADMDGFAAGMVAVGLGREGPEGVHICGMAERLRSLESYHERSAEGGRRTALQRNGHHKTGPVARAPASAAAGPPAPGPLVLESLSSPTEKTSSLPSGESGARHKREKPVVRDERVSPVTKRWSELYRDNVGEDYPGNYGTAGKAIRNLPRSYTSEKLVNLAETWWRSPDSFVLNQQGARIEAWVQHLPAQMARQNGARASPSDGLGFEGLMRMADEARRRGE